MAKKRNDFLSRIQAQQAREMEHAAAVGAAYLQAAVFDAAMLTLGYLRMFTSRVEVQPGPGALENLSEDELRALIRGMEGENDHDGKTGGQPDAGDPQ